MSPEAALEVAILVVLMLQLCLGVIALRRASPRALRTGRVLPAPPPEVLARFHQEAESEQDLHEEAHHGTRKGGKKVVIAYTPSARKMAIDHRMRTKAEAWANLPRRQRPRQ